MKNVLFASTALVAFAGVASAAEPITLTTSGYMNAGVTVSDYDTGNDGFGAFRDGEIHFTATGSSDNGITFGARVELEAYTTGDQIDENYVWASGEFGRIQIGGDDEAQYDLATGVIFTDARVNHYDGAGGGWFGINAASNNVIGDGAQVKYNTPVISGFQAAVSYTPNIDADGAGDANSPVVADDSSAWSFGANYRYEGEGFAAQFSGGYTDVDGNYGVDKATLVSDNWSIGARGEMQGFVVGAFYMDQDNVTKDIVVNGSYSTGPWLVGLGYSNSNYESGVQNDNGSDANANRYAGWVSYDVAPGVLLGAGVTYMTQGSEDETVGAMALNLSF